MEPLAIVPDVPVRFALADVIYGAVAATQAGCELLERTFGALPVSIDSATPPLVTIELVAAEDAPPSPTGAPASTGVRDGQMVVYAAGAARTAVHDEGGIALLTPVDAEHPAGPSRLQIARAAGDQNPWRTGRHLLAWGLQLAHNRAGAPMVHGAVMSRNGHGVIVVGASGSGKSTLAVAALVGGWQLHGDDMAVVRVGADGLDVTSVPRRMMVAPELLPALDGFAVAVVDDDDRGRWFVPDAVAPTPWLPLAAVVHVGHHDAEGAWHEAETPLASLAPALGDDHDDAVLRRNFGVATRFVATPTFGLLHAVSPDQRIARAVELLDAIADEVDLAR